MVQLSYPYMTTGKITALAIWTFVNKVMSLFFNMLSSFVIAFFPRSEQLLKQSLSVWLWSPRKENLSLLPLFSLPFVLKSCHVMGSPDSSVGKESACDAGDSGSIPGSGRSAAEGIGYPLQYSWASLVAQLVKNLPMWGRRIVWCTLTSWYLVSLLSVSIIHVSDIFLVGFWSWEISFIMWGCRGWGWQAARTWVSVSCEMMGFPGPIGWPGASQSICTQ